MFFGLIACRELVPDLDVMAEYVQQELQTLLATLASVRTDGRARQPRARTMKSPPSTLATRTSKGPGGMNPGDKAPDFELPDQDGKPRKLSELLANGPVVLFFYPAAMTTGCTKESCHFRDLSAEFAAAGAQIVGISKDDRRQAGSSSPTSTRSAIRCCPTPIGPSPRPSGSSAGGQSITPVQRATFVINTDGTIRDVIKSEVKMDVHADKALESLKAG